MINFYIFLVIKEISREKRVLFFQGYCCDTTRESIPDLTIARCSLQPLPTRRWLIFASKLYFPTSLHYFWPQVFNLTAWRFPDHFFFVWVRCYTMLCACHTIPTQKLLCLHVFRQAGRPQRVDCLAPKWETTLSVFPKDTASEPLYFL